jgi:hypothetical protein
MRSCAIRGRRHGKVVSEEELIAMPFVFEFSAEALADLEQG